MRRNSSAEGRQLGRRSFIVITIPLSSPWIPLGPSSDLPVTLSGRTAGRRRRVEGPAVSGVVMRVRWVEPPPMVNDSTLSIGCNVPGVCTLTDFTPTATGCARFRGIHTGWTAVHSEAPC